jgi:hypothetical protein
MPANAKNGQTIKAAVNMRDVMIDGLSLEELQHARHVSTNLYINHITSRETWLALNEAIDAAITMGIESGYGPDGWTVSHGRVNARQRAVEFTHVGPYEDHQA